VTAIFDAKLTILLHRHRMRFLRILKQKEKEKHWLVKGGIICEVGRLARYRIGW